MHDHALQTAVTDADAQQRIGSPDRIEHVRAYPVVQELSQPTQTAWGRYSSIAIVIVEVRTRQGVVGAGEVLARFAPKAYCELIQNVLAPRLVGQDPSDIAELWLSMRRALSGRAGGMLVKAIAGIDIALWDIKGRKAGMPIHSFLADRSAAKVPVYAASINWSDDEDAIRQVASYKERGFDKIKVKIGRPPKEAAKRIALVRKEAGTDITLYADANWAYALDEAEYVGHALAAHGYAWFEEPLDPDDEDGYEVLARRLTVPLAAGESHFTSRQAKRLIDSGALSYIQPNVTRTGGISETFSTARYAQAEGVTYAAHVGMSGILCETVGLHIAAALGGEAMVECAMAPNRFKAELADRAPGYVQAHAGCLEVPQGPGLGISIDWNAVRGMAAS
ncbi:MAG: mandelate racemase/muconate lactonizing enzyme family protein [Hyphomicrobiales bacterium]